MHRQTLAALADSQPCTYRQLAALNGWAEATVYTHMVAMRESGHVRTQAASNNRLLYWVSDLGRRFLDGAKGDVALPRTITKMSGVYVPPKWETRLDIGRR
jgi:DNA-binding IclR family transcriptional regulator